jgi:hypothetical protein
MAVMPGRPQATAAIEHHPRYFEARTLVGGDVDHLPSLVIEP